MVIKKKIIILGTLLAAASLMGLILSFSGAQTAWAYESPTKENQKMVTAAPLPVPNEGSHEKGDDLAVYLIQLEAPPVASYRGGIAGLEATNPGVRGEAKLDPHNAASVAYATYLEETQAAFLTTAENEIGRSLHVRFTYQHAVNGMAVEMTPAEADKAARLPGVKQVQREFIRYPLTDVGPQWIGAEAVWGGTNCILNCGEGVTVGVIDTGQNLDHPSFAEVGPIDGYVHTNPLGSGNFLGLCDAAPGTWVCNDKFIGYYIFTGEGTEDTDGHGSHTASTAAGNFVTATLDISTTNPFVYQTPIAGVAPHANIVGYDACTDTGGCPGAALIAAIDQTVADGVVDVINYSIGGGSSNPWGDLDSLAFLSAADAGLVPVTSAGNSGPGPSTVGSPADAPWLTAVGASTHNRSASNSLTNMSGGNTPPPADIDGVGLGISYTAPITYALYGGDAQCLTPFPPGTWSGEIVVCDRGTIARVQKGWNVMQGGAGGLVLANVDAQGESIVSDPHIIPGIHIGDAAGDLLRAWLTSGNNDQMATIAGTTLDFGAANGDIMAGFSSRGPNPAVANVIKPDVAAPGVSVLAAYRTGSGPAGDPAPWMDEFNFVSGTSMASPHTAGAAALLRAAHPTWSPHEIKSALMSTGVRMGTRKEDGVTPADAFDIGAGRIDVNLAEQAGLVLDETTANFTAANPSTGGDPRTLNLATMGNNDCMGTCTWTRTLSSTLSYSVTWTAMVTSVDGVGLMVEPGTFTLTPYGTQVVTVTANVVGLPLGAWRFAEAILSPTVSLPPTLGPSLASGLSIPPQAHLTVAVIPGVSLDPVIVVTPNSLNSSQPPDVVVTMPMTISNVGSADLNWSIVEDNSPLAQQPGGWSDNFDSYATGINLHGVGGWKGWDNNPAVAAFTADTFARSSPNSVDISGPSDLVQQYINYTSGQWTFTTWQYIPSGYSGQAYIVFLNTYNDGGPYNWSAQVCFDSVTGLLGDDPDVTCSSGATMPIIFDQWVEIRLEIDLTADTQAFYYNDQLLYQDSWTEHVSFPGPGVTNFEAVDLYAGGSTPIYYDDLSLTPSGGCGSGGDIPWAATSPISGTTGANGRTMVDVVFDATALATGTYTGTLCVNSNDPLNPLVEVPLSLNVTAAPTYGVDLSMDAALTGTVGTTVTYTVRMTNTGDVMDVYDVALSGHVWATSLSVVTATLNPGEGTAVQAWVTVPMTATDGMMDVVTVTATSQGDPGISDGTTLTTTAVVPPEPPTYGVDLSDSEVVTGTAGSAVGYTLWVTNTGDVTDTIGLNVTGVWTATASVTMVVVAPGESVSFTVSVDIPAGAVGSDVAVVTAVSQGDPGVTDTAELTTTVAKESDMSYIYLPFVVTDD